MLQARLIKSYIFLFKVKITHFWLLEGKCFWKTLYETQNPQTLKTTTNERYSQVEI